MIKLYRWLYRSSVTGNFVTRAYAEANPETTVRERLWFWQRARP